MPESKRRGKQSFTPPPVSRKPVRIGSPPWLVPVMIACFLIGLLWIVVYYIAGADVPVMENLNWWNIVIGFGFIGVGFALSTKWR